MAHSVGVTREFGERSGVEMTVDHVACYGTEAAVVRSSVATDTRKRYVHADIAALGEDALGLLDQNATVKCTLQLLHDPPRLAHRALLDQGYGRDVRHALSE